MCRFCTTNLQWMVVQHAGRFLPPFPLPLSFGHESQLGFRILLRIRFQFRWGGTARPTADFRPGPVLQVTCRLPTRDLWHAAVASPLRTERPKSPYLVEKGGLGGRCGPDGLVWGTASPRSVTQPIPTFV